MALRRKASTSQSAHEDPKPSQVTNVYWIFAQRKTGTYSPHSENGKIGGQIFKVKQVGRRNGVRVQFVARRGKGSHGTLFYGARFTIVRNPKDELKKGTLHAMLDQLGLNFEDL